MCVFANDVGVVADAWAYRTLRRGKHRLLLWEGQEADGSVVSSTPSKLEARDEMGRLEKVCRAVSRANDVACSYSHDSW